MINDGRRAMIPVGSLFNQEEILFLLLFVPHFRFMTVAWSG